MRSAVRNIILRPSALNCITVRKRSPSGSGSDASSEAGVFIARMLQMRETSKLLLVLKTDALHSARFRVKQ
jgi:hypothetical protein